MNNHGIICKNNNMIIFLIFLIITIFILINKKVKFAIDFSVIGFEYNFCININYFFDVITLYKEDFIKYQKRYKKNTENKKKLQDYQWMFEYLEVNRMNLDAKIGLEDVFVTSMAIPILATVLAIVLQKYFGQSTKRFSIKPVYNKMFFSLKGAIYVSIKLKDMIYIIFKEIFANKK